MNFTSLQLYAQMQEEINQVEALCKNEILKLENCFSIALRYWNKIKSHSESYVFGQEADEINFFKNIRPLFVAAMEYYTLLYQAVLFKPSNDKDKLVSYWLHQLKRVELFFARNRKFYCYYTSGRADQDNIYFMRSGNTSSLTDKPSFKNDIAASPAYIAARILGYQQYRLHIELQLKMLVEGSAAKVFLPDIIHA